MAVHHRLYTAQVQELGDEYNRIAKLIKQQQKARVRRNTLIAVGILAVAAFATAAYFVIDHFWFKQKSSSSPFILSNEEQFIIPNKQCLYPRSSLCTVVQRIGTNSSTELPQVTNIFKGNIKIFFKISKREIYPD